MSIPVPSPSISSTTTVAFPSPIAPRPAVILPGLGNNSSDYKDLTCTLSERYQIPTVVAKISRLDWLRNAAGLVDPNYWKGTLCPRPVLDWYFERMDDAISEAKQLSQQGSISLVGHSAGGWLARVYIQEFKPSDISLLLTLGTPHLGPPKGVPGVIDQTRGLLDYVEKNCAPAVYTPELKYVCIAGRYIQGSPLLANSSLNVTNSTENNEAAELVESASYVDPTLRSRFVGQGYKQVCGQADVWGDGVVPEKSAHLEGALNLSFEGIYHSPVGSDDLKRPWYGSPAIVEKWVHHLLE